MFLRIACRFVVQGLLLLVFLLTAIFAAISSAAPFTAPGSDTALEPWASKAQPGDVTKRHVEKIGTAEHKYTVVHGGTMDGTNCRSPMGCGMNREGAIEQTWQSNRAVRM